MRGMKKDRPAPPKKGEAKPSVKKPAAKKPAVKKTAHPTRPAFDAVKAKVSEIENVRENRAPGSVVNKQVDHDSKPRFNGTPAFFSYYWFNPPGIEPGRLQRMRDRLAEKGYWLADGDEYIPECSTAEIWMTYRDVAEEHKKLRAARAQQMGAQQRLVN